MIESMNMTLTIKRQNNKCLECKKELPTKPTDQVFFVMDQAKNVYRVYCMECGETKVCSECENNSICEEIDGVCCIHNESVERHKMCSPCSEDYFADLTDIAMDLKKDGLL